MDVQARQPLAARSLISTDTIDPVTLAWQDICYTVKVKKNRVLTDKSVLSGVSGHASHGTFTSILGASGSGKTSLLSVLADRLLTTKGASLTGSFHVNDAPRSNSFRLHCAYVQQTEVFYPFATVRETVEMAARLRLGKSESLEGKRQRAAAVIRQLGLSKAQDTKVGNGNKVKGISGGEMKRVAIACELISKPSVLMLDEPTSGLDSSAALNVLEILVELANAGCTVIASIHQPGSALYSMFQNLILLAEGRVAYFGMATGVVDYFNGFGLECPKLFNPAEYMLQITSIDFSSEEAEAKSRSLLGKVLEGYKLKALPAEVKGAGEGAAIQASSNYVEQFWLLFKRTLGNTLRNKFAVFFKTFQKIFVAGMLIFLYSDMDTGSAFIAEQNIKALLFFVTITGLFDPLFGTIQTFSPEVEIVLRERSNNLYAVAPYYLAKLIAIVVSDILPVVISNSISYWCLKLTHGFDIYLTYLAILGLCFLTSVSFALWLATLAGGSMETAQAMVAPVTLLLLLLAGFYVKEATVPIFIRWFTKIDYVNWTYESLAINNFKGQTLHLPNGETIIGDEVLLSEFRGAGKEMPDWNTVLATKLLLLGGLVVIFNVLGYLVMFSKGPKYLRLTALVRNGNREGV